MRKHTERFGGEQLHILSRRYADLPHARHRLMTMDFTAARLSVEHSIEIDARLIPVELEIVPKATLLEMLTARGCLAEVVNDAIELSK